MDRALTTQEDEELQDLLRQGLTHLGPSALWTLLRRYARDPDVGAAFTRDTGHPVPAFHGQAGVLLGRLPGVGSSPEGRTIIRVPLGDEGLAALLMGKMRQAHQAGLGAFYRYVLTHLKATGWTPPQEPPPPPPGYDDDVYAWSQATARAIRAGQWHQVDREAVAEEVESVGISQKHALGSHLKQLVMHLLKWHYQPSGRQTGHSWRSSILNARDEIAMILEDSPSLRRTVPEALDRRYPAARRLAQDETGLPLTTFPEACPWLPAQVLDPDFWPEG